MKPEIKGQNPSGYQSAKLALWYKHSLALPFSAGQAKKGTRSMIVIAGNSRPALSPVIETVKPVYLINGRFA